MHVLWLASWYPDEYEPTNGDFVQRHAKAVALLMPVNVIHVAQSGKDFGYLDKIVLNSDGDLHEAIHYFSLKKTGITWLDKIRYNKTYLSYYKKVIHQYIKKNGRPDLIHVHVPMKAGIIALKLLKQLHVPFIVSEHSSLYLKTATNNYYTRSFYFRHHTKRIFKHAAAVTNVSSAISEVLKSMFNLNDVKIIANVVDTNHFYHKPKTKNKIFRWLHVSSLAPLKNVDKIIEAFSEVSLLKNNWELIICGPVNKQYQHLVQQLNLFEKIKFIGEVSHEKVATEMQLADAFIMFSKHENFPCVIIEALCCGLPVLASNVGGISEAVDKTNGILVEANNSHQLQQAIILMMNNIDQFNTNKISEQAALKYNYTTIANKFLSVYNDVLYH